MLNSLRGKFHFQVYRHALLELFYFFWYTFHQFQEVSLVLNYRVPCKDVNTSFHGHLLASLVVHRIKSIPLDDYAIVRFKDVLNVPNTFSS